MEQVSKHDGCTDVSMFVHDVIGQFEFVKGQRATHPVLSGGR